MFLSTIFLPFGESLPPSCQTGGLGINPCYWLKSINKIKKNSNTDLTNLYLSVDRIYLLQCDSKNNHQVFKITTHNKFKELISADMECFINGISYQTK